MEGVKETITSPEREQIKQDILFIRSFFEYMDQTRVQRWREKKEDAFLTPEEVKEMKESDAAHTGLMHVLATNMLDKALAEGDDSFQNFDVMLMLRMIQLHDLEENVTGDVRTKDAEHYELEKVIFNKIKEKAGKLNYGKALVEAVEAYRERTVPEARFVKAIDELQAWFYMIYTRRTDASRRDFNNPETISGYTSASEFPTVKRIMDIIIRIMRHPSYIKSDVPTMELIQEQYRV